MPGRACLNCELDQMPDQGWVFDMVYDPHETPLIAAASAGSASRSQPPGAAAWGRSPPAWGH